jgi:hypothetical protein
MFPGRLVSVVAALTLLGLITLAIFRTRRSKTTLLRLLSIWAALLLVSLFEQSWPFHLAVWINLVFFTRTQKPLLLQHPLAVPVAVALLVVDIAANPVLRFGVLEIESIHRFFLSTDSRL